MLSGNTVIVISDDEEDPLPAPSNALTHTLKRPAPPSAAQSAPKQIRSYAAIAAAPTPVPVVVRPKKVRPKADPHVLLWIPHNGIQDHEGNDWDRLDVIGVFYTEAAADERLKELLEEHADEQFGNGHICVGDSWSDEIDLVVKSCDMFGFETAKGKPVKMENPHVLLWVPHNGLQEGDGNDWYALDVIGVFPTEEAAAERLEELMNEHADEQFGNGHICVGGSWTDEIDLVVKPCAMFGF
ncbi:hypothetical protein BJ741DRAFT_573123 [Chytriomyces cf. hyalinus JEL632]|nr:hypothetical protein BJ741DRAFT_573123 [Chytriomyces cf. hyalinus JEL632]